MPDTGRELDTGAVDFAGCAFCSLFLYAVFDWKRKRFRESVAT